MPNKITIILGPAGSGKTTLARQMAKKAGYVSYSTVSTLDLETLRSITDPIAPDGLLIVERVGKHNLQQIRSFIGLETVWLRPPYKEKSIEYTMPDLIITSSSLRPSDFPIADHIEIITLPTN